MTPYERYIQDMKERYHLPAARLELESDARPKSQVEVTVKDLETYNARVQRGEGTKLKVATASTSFKVDGKPMTRLYYDFRA